MTMKTSTEPALLLREIRDLLAELLDRIPEPLPVNQVMSERFGQCQHGADLYFGCQLCGTHRDDR